ncbi:hypothetical protein BH24ACI4_BH24ACI4_08620 [soil metagenome]
MYSLDMRLPADDMLPQLGGVDALFDPLYPFPATVTITRTSEEDYQTRQVVASIDGIHAGTLLWGDSVTCELEPGPHRIRVHNTLVWKTVDFVLAPGEQVYYEVVNRRGFGTLLLTILLGVGPLYVTVRRM